MKGTLTTVLKGALLFFALGLLFDIAYEQYPLYRMNQNTYLLHGLARGGFGLLREDWMANTADPTPVFSRLVELCYRVLPERAFYAEHALLAGVYLTGLLGIVHAWRAGEAQRDPSRAKSAFIALAFALIALHSGAVERLGNFGDQPVSRYLHEGLAYQYVLGHMYQPSAFGVFLVLSVALFLWDRPFAAVLAASLAASFHPTYVFSAAALQLGYALSLLREKNTRAAVLLCLLAAATLLPITIWAFVSFRATSPAAQAQANHLLVHSRIPHHTLPSRWLTPGAYGQVALVAAALFVVRKSRLLPILIVPSALALAVTVAQIVAPRDAVALLFPWRPSVFLVPIATSLLVGGLVWKLVELRHHRFAAVACAALGLITIFAGGKALAALGDPAQGALARFVARNRKPGQIYLVPPKLENIRLELGAPIFIDRKTHPYKDIELLEWSQRNQLASQFYAKVSCPSLEQLSSTYGITNVVLPTRPSPSVCEGWAETYRDGGSLVWEKTR